VYQLHPSETLRRVFTARPFQGAEPERASFVFVGLDANYSADIERSPIFPQLLDYLADGVAFWKKTGVHHPFLLPAYGNKDGTRYHRSFAGIGFRPMHAPLVSFVEVLHLPTCKQSKLEVSDLDAGHLQWLDRIICAGSARYVFLPATAAQLMRASGSFPWLPKLARSEGGALEVWHRTATTTVFCHYHLSTYGHQEKKKREQIAEIRDLMNGA
jgi:hypothetical protein